MSLRQGTTLIAGAGIAPYINTSTHNWEINGQDTGIQATPIPITIEEYNRKLQDGTLNTNLMYHISDNIPRVVRGITLSVNSWSQNGDYFYQNTTISGLQETDIVNVDLSSQLTDSDYMGQYKDLTSSSVLRIRANAGSITLITKKRPTMDIVIDVAYMKCIIVSQ